MISEGLIPMDEALRLHYLDAMGITGYVARAPLPGALPSPALQPSAAEAENVAAAPVRVSQLLAADPALSKPKPQHVPAATSTVAATPVAASASPVFQCQLAIWAVDDLLVLADMPRLDNSQQQLLRNILQAIGRNQSALPAVKQFSWPIPQRKDRSLEAARDHFQGMLDGGLLQKDLRQVLCFGSVAAMLLVTDDGAEPVAQYKDWPVTTVCDLHEMLADPSRKAGTWRALQVLVRT